MRGVHLTVWTIHELIKYWLMFALFAATLGAVANGTILGWSSPAQVMLEMENQVSFTVTGKDTQMFSSVFGIGAALGALPAGYVSGLFGRRTSMMLFEGFLFVGWIILVIPTSVWMLSAGRVLQGVGAGALCAIIPSYVGEIAEPQMRGRCTYNQTRPGI